MSLNYQGLQATSILAHCENFACYCPQCNFSMLHFYCCMFCLFERQLNYQLKLNYQLIDATFNVHTGFVVVSEGIS